MAGRPSQLYEEGTLGRTLSTDRRGTRTVDDVVTVDPPYSEFAPQTDLNDTSAQPVRYLSPTAENEDGRVDLSPPFGRPNPDTLVFGMTDAERMRPAVRNNDREDY